MEEEANHFASVFLFPRRDLKNALRGRKVTLATLAALKPEWKMSVQGILYAAQREQIITKNQGRYLWTQISSKGWKTQEPPSLDFEHDRPTVMPTIVRAHLDDLGYEKSEVVRMSKMHEHEFDLYYQSPNDADTRPRLRIIN